MHSDAEWFEILIKSKNELLNFDLFWCLFSSLDLKASEKVPQSILDLFIAFLEISENLHLLHKMGDFGKFTRHGVPCLLYSGIRVASTPSKYTKRWRADSDRLLRKSNSKLLTTLYKGKLRSTHQLIARWHSGQESGLAVQGMQVRVPLKAKLFFAFFVCFYD